MSMTAGAKPVVVVALEAGEHEDYVVELAGNLAARDGPELLGLFVENAHLLEHASSRLAREIMLTGAERALDRGVLERQIRAQAARARALFEAASARLGLRHRFEIARGDIIAEPIKRAVAAQALVVGLAREAGGSAATVLGQLLAAELPVVVLARQGWQSGRSIAALVNDLAAADAMLDAAARLALQSRSRLTLLLATAVDDSRTQLGRLKQALQSRGIFDADIVVLSEYAVPGILLAARASRARLLALPTPSRSDETRMLDELARRFPGALMLVRPSRGFTPESE